MKGGGEGGETLPGRINVSAAQVTIVNGLSDLSEKLGLIQAGEFRSGNRVSPGDGFSGVRIAYPPMTYGGSLYNIAGVDADTLMFGLSATDGSALAGGGTVRLDSSGLTIVVGASTDPRPEIVFEAGTPTTKGKIGGYSTVSNETGIYLLNNLYYDGTNWNVDSTTAAGAVFNISNSVIAHQFRAAFAPTDNPATLETLLELYLSDTGDGKFALFHGNIRADGGQIIMQDIATPAAAADGYGKLWSDTDGNLRFTDTGGENWYITRSTSS